MRIDDLPQSDNVEDRRGSRSGGFTARRAGHLGLGTVSYTHLTLPTTPYV